ncbi:MAG: hypothetical protein ACTHNZ_05805 [Trinickia sp.]|uniref:hypothetical protein n=1 Tax=Trinickia sp. TaxID=2571163 RepID=UPI003F7FAA1F
MSAPETTSRGRPSLISETAPGAPDNSSRILASLEGRVVAQQAPRPRRSKKPLIAAGLALAGLVAVGAWQWQRLAEGGRSATAVVAGADKPPAAAAPAGQASGAAAAVGAASVPQSAIIVADDATTAAPNGTASDPLSRALANGAVPSADKNASTVNVAAASASTPASAASATLAAGKSAAIKSGAARADRENAKSRHAEKQVATRMGKHAKGVSKHDDPDADLLAALVARTKPYDARAPQSASDAKASSAKTRPVSLAAQVKQCDKSNFFEAQLCRWRVCSDHWGKDPVCPSANAPASSQAR